MNVAVSKNAVLITCACLGSILLGGCGKGADSASATGTGGSVTLDVAAFKGGYGIDFYEAAAKEYEAKHPGVTIKVSGDPRIWEQLRPRLVAGNPPDLMFPGWGLDHWALVADGGLKTLDSALDGKPAEGTGTWRDTFEPALLKLGQQDGKQYVMPYYFNVWGMWYEPALFAQHGWQVPKTYDELLALCGKIKAAGIAPITFQGKYPYYMLQGMVLPWLQNVGGKQALEDAQNLVPGAWNSPAMLKVATMIADLKAKGYFEEGAVGMSHTDSQTEFVNGKAAMIPCGTWLQSEMAKTMPPGTKLQYMPTPVAAVTGEPTAISIDIEPWMVPSAGKHPDEAIDFFKFMTSLSMAKKFVEEKATLMAVKGSEQTPKLPPTLVQPLAAFKASKYVWSYQMRYWYPAMEKEIEGALTSLLNGQLTPAQFCDKAEKEAQRARDDSSLKKHKVAS